MLNATNLSLPRELRRVIRSRITAQHSWTSYRIANLAGRDASDMTRAEIIQAANYYAIDILAEARALGVVPASSNPDAPVNPGTPGTTMPAAAAPVTAPVAAGESF